MDNISPKKEMQRIILQYIENHAMQDAYKSLEIYKNVFGADSFTDDCESLAATTMLPLVSLICLSCSDEYIDEYLSRQVYSNIEVVQTTQEDTIEDIIDYIFVTESKYICFLEPNHYNDSYKILRMVEELEKLQSVNICITPRNYIDSSGVLIAHSGLTRFVGGGNKNNITGHDLLAYSVINNENMYENLSALMVSAKYARNKKWTVPNHSLHAINVTLFLYQLLLSEERVHIINSSLVSTIVKPYQNDALLQSAYKKIIASIFPNEVTEVSPFFNTHVDDEITFFYTDKGEYYNLEPIANEALKRGYKVKYTQDIKQKAEIGVYCQHVCYPENSKFSVILLHDMAQGHIRWPNIWESERWNKFDIGIVPGRFWAERWSQCACFPYANPRCGTFELGYPKSDLINSDSLKHRADELRQQMHLKYAFSVLYAPSWENDEKEDDFVRALASLPVNLLLKQAHWSDEYDFVIKNIEQMRALHENKYDNVYYIEPEENILAALELCDMVVSDESSVMAEALMFHKPSIAVIDWLIPDMIPSRPASVPMDYVTKCKKVELREYVEKFSTNVEYYRTVLDKGEGVFSNQGHVCKDIMDAIEYYTNRSKAGCDFLGKKLTQKYTTCSLWN